MTEITWEIEKEFIVQKVDGIETIKILPGGKIALREDGITQFHKCVVLTGDTDENDFVSEMDFGTKWVAESINGR